MDTFFFILRKNNHQITVLHVYHHASMLNIWWFVMNWVPCGHCKSHVGTGGTGVSKEAELKLRLLEKVPFLWISRASIELFVQDVLMIVSVPCALSKLAKPFSSSANVLC